MTSATPIHRHRASRSRRGFSLVELVVVIGIIALLAALVLGVASVVVRQSEVRETQNAITLFEAALNEFESSTGRPITYGQNQAAAPGQPAQVYDVQSTLNDEDLVVATLAILNTSDSARTLLSKIGSHMLRPISDHPLGTLELVDPWERRVVVVFPGRKWVPADGGQADEDGTIRTARENIFGVCRNAKPLIVSAGIDGFYGSHSGSETERRRAEDNIYSYEPQHPVQP